MQADTDSAACAADPQQHCLATPPSNKTQSTGSCCPARGGGPAQAQDRCAAPHGRLQAALGPRPRRRPLCSRSPTQHVSCQQQQVRGKEKVPVVSNRPLHCVMQQRCHHTDFGGLSSLAALVIVRLDVVPLPTRSQRRLWRVVCWADILLDVIGGVERTMREGCPGTMAGVSQHWFSGHFRQVFSTPMHYPAFTLVSTNGANQAS